MQKVKLEEKSNGKNEVKMSKSHARSKIAVKSKIEKVKWKTTKFHYVKKTKSELDKSQNIVKWNEKSQKFKVKSIITVS